VQREWRIFIENRASFAMVVEDLSRPPDLRCVGFAQTVFVSSDYVKFVLKGAPPYANQHATRQLPDGSWPLLDANAVRADNAGKGLNALTTRFMWSETELNPEDQRAVREYMDLNFPFYYRGYRYRRLLIEAIGSGPREMLENAGYLSINDYNDYYQQFPETPAEKRPCLMTASREEPQFREGTLVSRIFAFTPPRFGLKPREQEMLWLTLLGASDSELAARLGVGVDAIKKRWETIYGRVQERDTELLPHSGDLVRGPEKKERLLLYLRDHLEEMRPTIRREESNIESISGRRKQLTMRGRRREEPDS
jgi:DNA-binding CsgD family transcriptional regulator